VTVLLALCADFVFGLGVALQIRAATQAPLEESLRPGLLVRLVHRPVWLAGLVLEIGGFALHAAALAHGSLVLVQPLLTLDLVFTLAICAAWSRTRLTSRDWLGVAATIVGVSVFLLVAAPDRTSRAVADTAGWFLCVAWVAVVGGAVTLWAARSMGIRRSALLAVAAGIANGFMAVLTKAFADRLEQGVWQTVRSWQPYAVVVAGIVAMLLIQSAYQAGHPTVVLPTINVVDPLVSSLVGVTLFGESVALTGVRGLAVVASIALAVVGLVALGRNPLVQREELPIAEIAS
jgi:drug/metabolite transporter (DMT)-like permease